MAEGRSMVVISRRKGESIVINDDIHVVVVGIHGHKVRIGVESPRESTRAMEKSNILYEAVKRRIDQRKKRE